jgi:hypothetical protein
MLGSWWRGARSRVVLVAACAALALGRACSAEVPPPATLEGLVALLQEAGEVQVRAGEFGWEPSSGPVFDLVLGRQILFLGAKPGAPRDVYRAAVAVSWEGKPLFVQGVRNLTQTAGERGLRSLLHARVRGADRRLALGATDHSQFEFALGLAQCALVSAPTLRQLHWAVRDSLRRE